MSSSTSIPTLLLLPHSAKALLVQVPGMFGDTGQIGPQLFAGLSRKNLPHRLRIQSSS